MAPASLVMDAKLPSKLSYSVKTALPHRSGSACVLSGFEEIIIVFGCILSNLAHLVSFLLP